MEGFHREELQVFWTLASVEFLTRSRRAARFAFPGSPTRAVFARWGGRVPDARGFRALGWEGPRRTRSSRVGVGAWYAGLSMSPQPEALILCPFPFKEADLVETLSPRDEGTRRAEST